MQIKRMLLPLRGQRVDESALEFACSLARHEHGSVCLLCVIEVPRQYAVDAELPEAVAQCEALLRNGEEYLKAHKVKVEAELLQARDAGPAIVQEAHERGVDAILLGLPYRRRQDTLTTRSDATYILEYAQCPVLLYRESKPDEAGRRPHEPASVVAGRR